MELCTTSALSNPTLHHRPFTKTTLFCCKPSLHFKQYSFSLSNKGGLSYRNTLLRATTSEETANEASQYTGEISDGVVLLEDVPPVEKDVSNDAVQAADPPKEEPSIDERMQPLTEILDRLNIKLDFEDSYAIILYGSGALVAVWFLSAVVGAIDSIPLFPKLMEVVGLAYTLWFTTRYLIFKQNREELAAKIEDLKQQVLGTGDD
ncbi:hypothetical protein Ancab_003498 [Ancistrocladus abbreviatus]